MFWILISVSMNFVTKSLLNNKSSLVQVMAWCPTGDKPLLDLIMAKFIKRQWVNLLSEFCHYIFYIILSKSVLRPQIETFWEFLKLFPIFFSLMNIRFHGSGFNSSKWCILQNCNIKTLQKAYKVTFYSIFKRWLVFIFTPMEIWKRPFLKYKDRTITLTEQCLIL